MNIFGDRVKMLREQKGLSQKDFAKLFSLSNTTISQWENGKRMPDSEMVLQVAKFFDVSTDYLLGNSNIRNPERDLELPETVALYLPEGFEELSQEAKEEVVNFIDYIMVKYAKKKEDNKQN